MGTRNNVIRSTYCARQSSFAEMVEDKQIVVDSLIYKTGYISLTKCFIPTYDKKYNQYVVYAESYYRGGHITILYHYTDKNGDIT